MGAQFYQGYQGFLRRPGRGASQYGRPGSFGRFAGYGGQLQTTRRHHQVWRENSLNSRTSPFKIQTTAVTAKSTTTTTTPTTTTRTTTRRSTTMQIMREKQFSPVLRTEANPYLSIDMDRFAVIPAVPGSAVAVPSLTNKARVPKTSEVREDEDLLSGFSPVPAVPLTTASNTPPAPPAPPAPAPPAPSAPPAPTPRARQKPSLPGHNTAIGGGAGGVQTNVVSQKTTGDISQTTLERKAFKRCHGKCVQKFCLPIEDLGVYDACTNKCKGICEQ